VKQGVISRNNKLKSAVMWMSLMSECYWWCLVSQRIEEQKLYPPITYYCTGLLILDHSYSRWEFDKSKNCWNKSFRTYKILTLLYQQFSYLLISQRHMSGPRLGALPNNRWSEGSTLFRIS
jgi:hypothetical protein